MQHSDYNTQNLAQGKFRPHGYVEAIADGNLLRHQAWGPFNDEFITAFSALQEKILPQVLVFPRWGDLVVFHRSALAARSTFDAFAAHMQQRVQQGRAPHATALVMAPEVEGGSIMSALFAKLYQELGLVLQTFDDLVTAEQWIRDQLAQGAVAQPLV
ncbi:MAG: hypothetical protein RL748_23 [Pseudomonadota bacterium]|jgi:hypothetical protein